MKKVLIISGLIVCIIIFYPFIKSDDDKDFSKLEILIDEEQYELPLLYSVGKDTRLEIDKSINILSYTELTNIETTANEIILAEKNLSRFEYSVMVYLDGSPIESNGASSGYIKLPKESGEYLISILFIYEDMVYLYGLEVDLTF